MIEKSKNSNRMEKFNKEVNMEQKRKLLIDRLKSIKIEKNDAFISLTKINKEIEEIKVEIDFYDKFEEYINFKDPKIQHMLNKEEKSSKVTDRRSLKKKISFADNDTELLKTRTVLTVFLLYHKSKL